MLLFFFCFYCLQFCPPLLALVIPVFSLLLICLSALYAFLSPMTFLLHVCRQMLVIRGHQILVLNQDEIDTKAKTNKRRTTRPTEKLGVPGEQGTGDG